MYLYVCLGIFLLCFWASPATGQQDSLTRKFTVELEIRPRIEYLDKYNNGSPGPKDDNIYTTQRNRLILNYAAKRLKLHASLQEIHLWGVEGKASAIGSVNAFELYAEPTIAGGLKVRVGRQALSLDNGRIFSAAPWASKAVRTKVSGCYIKENWKQI